MDVKNKIKEIATRKRIIIPAIIVLACAGYFFFHHGNKVEYQTKELQRCTITQVVEASGTINPVNIVSVGSTVSGLMKEKIPCTRQNNNRRNNYPFLGRNLFNLIFYVHFSSPLTFL